MAVTIQKIIGSSEGNPDNGLSARNKINSNFQNLVDAILSIQVEAGTTSFENLTGKPSTLQGYGITDAASSIHSHEFSTITNKPTTLSGYGIADSYDKTQVDTLLSGKMSSAIFNDLFEKVNIGTELAPVYAIKAKYDFYGIGEVSAYGIGIGGSGGSGLIQTVYGYNNLGGTFLDSTLTDTFNAYTINQLASRITTLEGGTSSNISISTIGTGNAITTATKSGDVITFAKDSTFVLTNDSRLTNARYNPYALTFTGYLSAVYDGSNSVSIALPTKLSQFTNDIGAGTSITKAQVEAVLTGTITSHTHNYLTGNQTISVTGDATGSGTTSIALTLANSGVTAGTYRSVTVDDKGRVTGGTNPTTLAGYGILDAASSSHTHNYAGSTSAGGKANAVANQLAFSGYSTLSYDGSTAVTIPIPNNTSQLTNGAGYITSSGSITGNAGTATALQNSRTIWGQSFNGTANVTGALSNVTNLTMSGTLNVGSAQLIYDSTTNTLRVQKSDGSAIGFYSTGEVASYGVGATGGTSYINGFLNILSTNDNAAGINLLKITSNNVDVLKYTRKYNGYDTYDLILGSWSSIQASNRLDFYANQIFFNGNNTYYQSSLNVNRIGDASSTSTQKNSYPLVFQTSIWNGSSQDRIYHSIKATASTTINGSTRLSFIANTDEAGQNGTEILEINSTGIKINGTITSTGPGTFNGGSFSSLRSLKTIHKDWQGNALDEIAKFQIRDFNYKNQLDCNRTLGFIVDEIPESMSDYVLANKDKNAINLYTLHALAFLGLQETKSEVDKLKEKIISLKNEIDYLKIKLN